MVAEETLREGVAAGEPVAEGGILPKVKVSGILYKVRGIGRQARLHQLDGLLDAPRFVHTHLQS